MKKLSLAAATFAVVSTALVGCAGNADSGPTPAASASVAQQFTIAARDDYRVAGSFVARGSVVTFDSRMTPEGVSTVDVTVNGATLTVVIDLFSHKATEDGGGNTFTPEDLLVLRDFEKYLNLHGEKLRPWERLFKVVAMYSAAPTGHTVLQREIGKRPDLRDGNGRVTNTVSDEQIIYICKGYDSYTVNNNDDWGWAEHDSLCGEGGSGGSCQHGRLQGFYPIGCQLNWNPGALPPSTANQANDPNWVGYQTVGHWYGNSGVGWNDGNAYNDTSTPDPSSRKWTGGGACEGRCGAGCPRTYNFYFVKDCFDHDTCADFHRGASVISSSGDCGFEFQDAQDDFVDGSSSEYTSTCGNVSSSCPETYTSDGTDDATPAGW